MLEQEHTGKQVVSVVPVEVLDTLALKAVPVEVHVVVVVYNLEWMLVGTPVMEAVGTPVMEAVGTPVMEAVGNPVIEAVGNPVMEVVGTPVMEVVGTQAALHTAAVQGVVDMDAVMVPHIQAVLGVGLLHKADFHIH